MIDRYIDQLIKSDDFCEIFRHSDSLIEYLYNLYELGYIVVKLEDLRKMRKDDIFANELIGRITIKYVKEILLDVDWDDYGKYQEDKCGALDCNNCEFAGKQYCQEKIFLKYLKEKPL